MVPVVDRRAVLQPDAATVREKRLVERAQVVATAVDVLASGGLAGIAVAFEGRDDGVVSRLPVRAGSRR
jgi:hypothetical protein